MNNSTQPSSRDKKADRERIECLYLMRQISKQEFTNWLKEGNHNVN